MVISENIIWMSGGALAGVVLTATLFYGGVRKAVIRKVKDDVGVKQDQFISIASHYLLSPITIIQVAVSQLQERDAELKPEQRSKLYSAIVQGQQRLWILAEQFLIVGEVDHNRIKLQMSVNKFPDTIEAAILSVREFAKQKNITVTFTDQTDNGGEGRYDARRLKQALIALLDNAIKFGPVNSKVLVQLSFSSKIFSIYVQDQGIGMPKEIMEHLSERFYRGTQLYNFDYEGVGLGLHIAYAIIQLHEGSLAFDSQPGKGTVASIALPSL